MADEIEKSDAYYEAFERQVERAFVYQRKKLPWPMSSMAKSQKGRIELGKRFEKQLEGKDPNYEMYKYQAEQEAKKAGKV